MMKKRLIWMLVAVFALVLAIYFGVRLIMGLIGGLNALGDVPVDVEASLPLTGVTPEPDLTEDRFYDAPDPEDYGAPTPIPEVMVRVPVEQTPEELALDELP